MEGHAVPPAWGQDTLSQFLDKAHHDAFCTFARYHDFFVVLASIGDVFDALIRNLGDPRSHFLECLFVPRSHAAYLAGVRLGLSGQQPEAYMCLRGCLENALYGFFLNRREDLQEAFLRRHQNDRWLGLVKKHLRPSAMLDLLRAENLETGRIAKTLYERTINLGAHPNPYGMLAGLEFQREEKREIVLTQYLNPDPVVLGLCLKSAAQVGVTALDIIALVLPEPFQSAGLRRTVDELRRGL